METGEILFFIICMAILIALIILVVRIPIIIAKTRGIAGGDLSVIAILSWLGLLIGITWIAALVCSLVWSAGSNNISASNANSEKSTAFEALEKLGKLKENGIITQQEFEQEKKNIMSSL